MWFQRDATTRRVEPNDSISTYVLTIDHVPAAIILFYGTGRRSGGPPWTPRIKNGRRRSGIFNAKNASIQKEIWTVIQGKSHFRVVVVLIFVVSHESKEILRNAYFNKFLPIIHILYRNLIQQLDQRSFVTRTELRCQIGFH